MVKKSTTSKKNKNIKSYYSFNFFKKIFILYWFFSLLGHYAENFWAFLNHIVTGDPYKEHIVSTIIPLASPYGLGFVLIILIVWPLIKSRRINPIAAFVLNSVIAAVTEYFSAAFVVMIYGRNDFWDYSMKPLNINGYICFESIVIFGIAATLFIYFIYPLIEKLIQRFNRRQINIIFWILFISYILDSIHTYTK